MTVLSSLSGLASVAANATWRDVDWARDQLRTHHGKVVRFEAWPPVFPPITLRISPDGDWEDAVPVGAADATFRMTPALLGRWMTDPGKLASAPASDVSGDAALVETLRGLTDVLPLAIEEKLSGVIGPLAVHGLSSAVQAIGAWPGYAAKRAGAGIAAYWTQESAALPGRPVFESFCRDLAELSARVDALSARLDTRGT